MSVAITGKKFYTYILIDPRNNETFYVGKGQGKRINPNRISNEIKEIIINCKECNKEIIVKENRLKKFCCQSCSNIYKWKMWRLKNEH